MPDAGRHLYCISNANSIVRANTLAHFDNDIPAGFLDEQFHYEVALEMVGFNTRGLQSQYIGIECDEIEQCINTTQYDNLLRITSFTANATQTDNYAFYQFKKKIYFSFASKSIPRITLKLVDLNGSILKLTDGQATVARLHIRQMEKKDENFIVRVISNKANGSHNEFAAKLPTTLELHGRWHMSLKTLSHPAAQVAIPITGQDYIRYIIIPLQNRNLNKNKMSRVRYRVEKGMNYTDLLDDLVRKMARTVDFSVADEVGANYIRNVGYVLHCGIRFNINKEGSIVISFEKLCLIIADVAAARLLGWPMTKIPKSSRSQDMRALVGCPGTEYIFKRPWDTYNRISTRFLLKWDLNVYEQMIPLPTNRVSGTPEEIARGFAREMIRRLDLTYPSKFEQVPRRPDDKAEVIVSDMRLKWSWEDRYGAVFLLTTPEFAQMLGFDVSEYQMSVTTFCIAANKNAPILAHNQVQIRKTFRPNLGMIYCNVIKPVLIGARYAPLLRVFDVPDMSEGVITHEFEHPDKVVVENNVVNEIAVKIMRHDGLPLYFINDESPVIMTLEFQKI